MFQEKKWCCLFKPALSAKGKALFFNETSYFFFLPCHCPAFINTGQCIGWGLDIVIKLLFLCTGIFYWQCAHFIELFFNYALFLIEFVDVQGDCGWRSRAKLPTEAGPGRGFLLAHNLRPVVWLSRVFMRARHRIFLTFCLRLTQTVKWHQSGRCTGAE